MREIHLTPTVASSLLNNGSFLRAFPEYAAVRAAAIRPAAKSGCSSCQKKRQAVDISNHFMNVTRSLAGPRLQALKEFLNVGAIRISVEQRRGGMKTGTTTISL